MKLEVKSMVSLGGKRWTQKGAEGVSRIMTIFCFMIWILIIWVCSP